MRYSANRDRILAYDVSPYGVGVVLSHKMEDGTERPLGFVSQTLAPAEKKCLQLYRDDLAVIFGIQRFHKYLNGRLFVIVTDLKLCHYLVR